MTERSAELACTELVELVTDYLEGLLPTADRDSFERHIAGCRGCAAYLRQMRDLVRTSGRVGADLEWPPPPAGLLRAFARWKAQRA